MTALLALAQLCALCAAATAIARLRHLPDNVDGHFAIYDDLANAQARIMMPAKQGGLAVLSQDARTVSEMRGGDRPPQCPFSGEAAAQAVSGGGTLALTQQAPRWMLPDDNSGLEDMARMMVRTDSDLQCAALRLLHARQQLRHIRIHAYAQVQAVVCDMNFGIHFRIGVNLLCRVNDARLCCRMPSKTLRWHRISSLACKLWQCHFCSCRGCVWLAARHHLDGSRGPWLLQQHPCSSSASFLGSWLYSLAPFSM